MKRWRRRVSADMNEAIGWLKTPVPPPARSGTGTIPGAGKAPPLPAPAPGQPVRSRPWMTAEFYPEGHVIVRDHIQRKQFKFAFPTGDDIAGEIIRDLCDGQE